MLLVLMVAINALLWRYFSQHQHQGRWSSSKEKRRLLTATIVYCVALLYRVVYNTVKLAYDSSSFLGNGNPQQE